MTFDPTAAIAVFLIIFIAGIVRQVLRRTPRRRGPLPDVPDASPTAVPIEAPGMTLPYSSLDPFSPPKRHADGTRVDGVPEST